jgi:hypothetical protein
MNNALDPWKLIGRISVEEAAFPIVGTNPLREDLASEITAMANTYELAISVGVATAHHYAWVCSEACMRVQNSMSFTTSGKHLGTSPT